jgi:hypothetical protein
MPKYNIELRTQGRIWDALSVERSNHTEVRVEVAKFVGELLKDHADKIWIDEDWRIDVTDENGLILFVMHLFVTNAAALAPPRRP